MRIDSKQIIRFGLYEADLSRGVLLKGGLRVKLQSQPFRLLALFLERPGEVIPREEIRERLWSADTFVEFDDGLNNAIKKLRIALCDSADNARFIETLPREGYRFLVPVTHLAGPVPEEMSGQSAKGSSEPAPASVRRSYRVFILAGLTALVAAVLLVWQSNSSRKPAGFARTALPLSAKTDGLRGSVNPQAYDEYLQGRQYFKERKSESLAKAVDHFNLAIERDPNFAEAYAGLADCYIVMPMLSSVSQESTYPKARQAAERAISLNGSLADAHLAVAEIRLYLDWDFAGAEKEFKRAIELDSRYAQAYQWYAEFLSLMGRHTEALEEIQTALKLDPSSMMIHHQAGQILQAARRYAEALEQYRQALQIQAGFAPTYSAIGFAYRRQGRFVESREAQRQTIPYWDPAGAGTSYFDSIAKAYSQEGPRGFYRATLEVHKKFPLQTHAYYYAWDYALLGDKDQALQWLKKSFEAREGEILGLQNDPELDSLRSDVRFQELVKKIGIPPVTQETPKSKPDPPAQSN